jgi:hypothetical protein
MVRRRHIAIHEAGHAVMACRFSAEIIKVSIVRDGDVADRVFEAFPS